MPHYAEAAHLYDLLYRADKDYAAEAERLAALIRDARPDAHAILDVGSGTGEHARRLTDLGFAVDGVDLEPAFVAIARAKCPEGRFSVGDMRSFALPERYDVVVSLFSAIGYAADVAGLGATLTRMAAHLRPGGLVLVEPWFEPGVLTDRWISLLTAEDEDVKVSRMSVTRIAGATSTLEFQYLIGRDGTLAHMREEHVLGLFTEDEMMGAFRGAGLSVRRIRGEGIKKRGLYVGEAA